jgi:hypothetical protein
VYPDWQHTYPCQLPEGEGEYRRHKGGKRCQEANEDVYHPDKTVELTLRHRRRRGGRRGWRTRWLACGVAVTPTVARDAQAEALELFFNTQTHGSVCQARLWLNLPPLTLFAETPVSYCHHGSLSRLTPHPA